MDYVTIEPPGGGERVNQLSPWMNLIRLPTKSAGRG
jgi:hypothetical protein